MRTWPPHARGRLDGAPVRGDRPAGELRPQPEQTPDPASGAPLLDLVGAANAHGARVRPQVHGRTVSLLLGLQTFHAAQFCPSWGELGLGLMGWQEQAARLAGIRPCGSGSWPSSSALEGRPVVMGFMDPARTYLLGDPPRHKPGPQRSSPPSPKPPGARNWEVLGA